MFAVACLGCEKMVQEFESLHDDYSKIMVQVLELRTIAYLMDHDIRGHGFRVAGLSFTVFVRGKHFHSVDVKVSFVLNCVSR